MFQYVYEQKEKMEYCIVLELLQVTFPRPATPLLLHGSCSDGAVAADDASKAAASVAAPPLPAAPMAAAHIAAASVASAPKATS